MKRLCKQVSAGLLLLLIYTGPGQAQSCAKNGDDVRVLVAYTSAVAAGTANVLQTLIQPSIDNMNIAYHNSGINHEVKLVRAVEINYNEPDDLQQSLDDFKNGAGPFNVIANMRVVYHADVCVLITSKGQYTGIAAGIAVDRGNAYCAVKNASLVARFSMAHEIGHLYGCRHEFALDPTPGYSHGYVFPDLKDPQGYYLHTIMAYGTVANNNILTNPIPYFSNPSLTYMGKVLGNPDTCNEAGMMNQGYNRIKGPIITEPVNITRPETIKANETADVNAYNSIHTAAGVAYTADAGSLVRLRVENGSGSIVLQPGFRAKAGSNVRIYICSPAGEEAPVAPRMNMATAGEKDRALLPVKAYPNPFSQKTVISYRLLNAQAVSLTLYNQAGMPVSKPLQGQLQQAGAYQYVIDGARLAAGIYVYRLQYGDHVKTGRLVKLP